MQIQSVIKIIKAYNVDLIVITPPNEILFTPFAGKTFVPTKIIAKTRKIVGTVTTPPQFKLTNGTADVLAAAALTTGVVGSPKATPITPTVPIDHTHPLTLVKTVAAAGSTVYKADLYIEGYLLS
jgi:hypothetical protein